MASKRPAGFGGGVRVSGTNRAGVEGKDRTDVLTFDNGRGGCFAGRKRNSDASGIN